MSHDSHLSPEMNNQGELVGFQHKTKVGSPYHLWEERFVTGLLLHLGDDANRWGMVNAKKTGFIQEKFFNIRDVMDLVMDELQRCEMFAELFRNTARIMAEQRQRIAAMEQHKAELAAAARPAHAEAFAPVLHELTLPRRAKRFG